MRIYSSRFRAGLEFFLIILLCGIASIGVAQQPAGNRASISARDQADLALFEREAQLSKELGATHMLVTDGLPSFTSEMDAMDPYPMWFVHHAGMLTIF